MPSVEVVSQDKSRLSSDDFAEEARALGMGRIRAYRSGKVGLKVAIRRRQRFGVSTTVRETCRAPHGGRCL